MEVARIPVEHDAHPAARTKGSRWTPLHAAVERGNIEILRILIEHGEDPTAAAGNGWTPLHVASSCGNVEVARFLIEHGADPTAQADDGRTPLVVATEVGNVEVIRILVEHRTDTTTGQPTQSSRFVYYFLFFCFMVEIYLHFMHWQ
jgi:ankyrin